jgi:DNA-binding CsgD family transcriptional regulator
MVADDAEIDSCFAVALAQHERSDRPLERARTELCYGERLRRAGRRSDARAHLRSALGAFDRAGAVPWSERARAELRATGETARRRDPTAAERLTAQELQVALAVAAGRTNREAAAALFLSPKTIEYHLHNAYRKLGVRSRTQLARQPAHETPVLEPG